MYIFVNIFIGLFNNIFLAICEIQHPPHGVHILVRGLETVGKR